MNRSLLIAIGAGLVSGIVFTAPLAGAVSGLLVVNYFSQLPLLIIGLSLGAASAAAAAGAALLVTVGAIGAGGAVQFLAAYALPAVVVTRQALLWRQAPDGTTAWYPPGMLLALLTGYGIFLFLAAMVFFAGESGGLEGTVRAALNAGLARLAPSADAVTRASAVDLWAPVFPGLAVASWMVMMLINGTLAQAILVRSGRNKRPSPRYSEIALPRWLAGALAATLALWLVGDGVLAFAGKSMTIIVALAYVLQGLAVVHSLSRGWAGRRLMLIVFYLLLLFLLGWRSVALIAGLGLVEQWVGLRHRLGAASSDSE